MGVGGEYALALTQLFQVSGLKAEVVGQGGAWTRSADALRILLLLSAGRE